MRLAGRVALVTGSSRGIGRAIAVRFAHEGADLVINGRSPERVQQVCAELGTLGRRALPTVADVTDEAAVEEMVDATIRAYGRIDILVNNVGGTQPAAHRFLEDYSWDSWQQILALNLTSQFL